LSSMHRTLIGTVLLVGGLALAQQPPTQPQDPQGQTPSTARPRSANPGMPNDPQAQTPQQYPDRSTAKTGENDRAMNQTNDKKFATDAAIGSMAEVALGKLAAEKATNPEVKQFGQKMVEDHGKANDELKAAAQKESIDLPSSLDSKHQATVDKLSKLSGADFDKAYVKEMVKDHDKDVKEFQKEAQNSQNASIRDFAAKTLPTLQEHQKRIHDIDKNKMSAKSSSADRTKQQ